MSERHLKTGDPFPTEKKDTLRLYSMLYCPHAHKTRLVLAHKKISHEVVNINLKKKPDWFLERNPVGTVPALEINGKVLWESAICNEYLDEVYPGPRIVPSDPFEKARLRLLIDRWGKVITQFYTMLRNPADTEKVTEEVHRLLPTFESALTENYVSGSSVGFVDFYMWPHFERYCDIKKMGGPDGLGGEFEKKFPKMAAWAERMWEEPAVKACHADPKRLMKFIQNMRDDIPEYDDL